MGLVENEQAFFDAFAHMGNERVAVLGAAQRLIGDDESTVGRPWVDAKATLASHPRHKGTVVHLEVNTEALLHLIAPLQADGCRANDERKAHALAQQQLFAWEATDQGTKRDFPPEIVDEIVNLMSLTS